MCPPLWRQMQRRHRCPLLCGRGTDRGRLWTSSSFLLLIAVALLTVGVSGVVGRGRIGFFFCGWPAGLGLPITRGGSGAVLRTQEEDRRRRKNKEHTDSREDNTAIKHTKTRQHETTPWHQPPTFRTPPNKQFRNKARDHGARWPIAVSRESFLAHSRLT